MMFEYCIKSDLVLSYLKPPITKERYQKYIEYVRYYGTRQSQGLSPTYPYTDISVVVVAHNEVNLVLKCLDHIFIQNLPPLEVILVDNGLDDETVESLFEYGITHLRLVSNLGPSIGRNIGAAFSSASLLAFIDADGYIPRNYLDVAVRTMANDKIVAFRGKVKPTTGDESRYKQLIGHYDLGNDVIPSMIDTEGNSIFRRRNFVDVGGFEDALYGGEGPVLCYRMIEFYGYDKYSFCYDPELILYHDFHRDLNHLYEKYRSYLLLSYKTSLKYPFLVQLSNYYYALHSSNDSPFDCAPDEEISHIISQRKLLQLEISEELSDYYQLNATRRQQNKGADSALNSFTAIIQGSSNSDKLSRTIDSLLKQTIPNVEIVVIQDLLTDTSSQVTLDMMPDCVKLLTQDRAPGEQDAIYKGIEAATSPYIAYLKEGERIDPTYLEKAESVFEGYPDVGIVSCDRQVHTYHKISRDISFRDIAYGCFLPNGFCFRRDLSVKIGGFDGTLGECAEWGHWIGIAEQGFYAKVIPETLFFPNEEKNEDVIVDSVKRDQIRRMIVKHKSVYDSIFPDIIASKLVQIESLQDQLAYAHPLETNLSSSPEATLSGYGYLNFNHLKGITKSAKNLLFRPVSIAFSLLIACSTALLVVAGYLFDSLTGSALLLVLSTGFFTEILMLLVVWLHYHKRGIT